MIVPVKSLSGSINFDLRAVSVAKKVGRPAIPDPNSEKSRKPWLAEGISQRTYYRRKACAAAAAPEPEQHSAHYVDWFSTLGPIARLEHRAFVRRCVIAAFRADRGCEPASRSPSHPGGVFDA